MNARLAPIPLTSRQGATIYRHTLSFVLCAAAAELFPKRQLHAGYSLGRAYYFSFRDGNPFSTGELDALRAYMKVFIQRDLPIEKRIISLSDALDYFRTVKAETAAQLLEQLGGAERCVNALGMYLDLYMHPLLCRTGIIEDWELVSYHDGVLLRYPVLAKKQPSAAPQPEGQGALKLTPDAIDLPGIFAVFSESKAWGRAAGVYSVAQLNALVARREIKEFIRIVESYTDKRLSRIADMICTRRGTVKLVLIAGPSSSGKTTTAKRLSIQLKTVGIEPVSISLDDYYLDPARVPRDEKGAPDFECLEALDVPFLNEQLLDLFSGKEITLPSFDFKTGTRKAGRTIRLDQHKMLVLEGIHGLNNALTSGIAPKNKFKLYASTLTQLNIDEHNRISTTDNRLLRRLVRDYQFRGMGAERTLSMWADVQNGAEKHIFTFQNEADAVFNSALDYEIAVLKLYAEPLLRSVPPESRQFSEANRLLTMLNYFSPIPSEHVPYLSILREFIGGSDFKY
ncbi:MAG: nucleoside kinase [Spirochaetaceae bacterium]|nr:nucleoside kinase [Spirochaetaceae bacterium]